MIDDTLNKLTKVTPPIPSAEARKQAIAAGTQAYSEQQAALVKAAVEQEQKKSFQGNFKLLSLIHEKHQALWRNIMINFKRHKLLAGTAMASIATLFVTIAVMQQPAYRDQAANETPQIENFTSDAPADKVSVKDEDRSNNEINQPMKSAQKGQKLDQAKAKEELYDRFIESKPSPQAGPAPVVEEITVSDFSVSREKSSSSKQNFGALKAPTLESSLNKDRERRVSGTIVYEALSQHHERDKISIYPTPQNRDKFAGAPINPLKSVLNEPVSTLSVDVDTASYSVVRRSLMAGQIPNPAAVRVEEMINYFDYDYELPADKAQPFKPTVHIYPTPWNNDTKLMHIAIKGHDIVPAEKPKANLVFLLDVSGSMNRPNKLPLLKNAFKMMIGSLNDDDTVSIVTYAGRAATLLEPTSVHEKSKILAVLGNLRAGGSTAGAQGIEQAYALAESSFQQEGVNRVILATDGDFNVGITDPVQLKAYIERKRETGIFLSVLGFGSGNYNDALMQTLAQNGNGIAAYIDTLYEAQKVLVEEASSSLYPIAKDVKIQVEFNPATVAEYRLVGYETRMLRQEDFNNDKVDAAEIGAGHSVTALYEITPIGSHARMIDDLRYGERKKTQGSDNGEYAFLKMRYKLPSQNSSKLLTLAISEEQEWSSINEVSKDVQFSTAVAAFGQKLRNENNMRDFSYDDIHNLSRKGQGEDFFGYRAEFIRLLGLAKGFSGSK